MPASSTTGQSLPPVSGVKRRKVRRGTSNCWECKRRKVRCDLESGSAVCIACRRRGTKCIPQTNIPEETEISRESKSGSNANYGTVEERLGRVESLVKQLLGPAAESYHQDSDKELLEWLAQPHGLAKSQRLASPQIPTGRSLSYFVHSMLPSPSSVSALIGRDMYLTLSMGGTREQRKAIFDTDNARTVLAALPPASAHPIVLAGKLIQLAICLQHMDPKFDLSALRLGSNSVRDVADHYFCIATRHVTCNDELIASMDGLDVLILEATYKINAGNCYEGWIACRRAVATAQRLGLHEVSSQALQQGSGAVLTSRQFHLWVRLVYVERLLSLMLGLPTSVQVDRSVVNSDKLGGNALAGGLDRVHNVAIGRIVARNERLAQHRGKSATAMLWDCWKETQEIDCDLRQATRSMPVRWWALPTETERRPDETMLQDTNRLLTQIHHHYITVLLHLPLVAIPPSSLDATNASIVDSLPELLPDTTYNIFSAASASYETISRFQVYQDFKFTPLCNRGVEAKAVTAALTLLLAHISGHAQGRASVLDHRRPGDIVIVERVVERLASLWTSHSDAICRDAASILRKLLTVEARAANGTTFDCRWTPERPKVDKNLGQSMVMEEMGKFLRVSVPYFGTIRIVCLDDPTSTLEGMRSFSKLDGPTGATALSLDSPLRSNEWWPLDGDEMVALLATDAGGRKPPQNSTSDFDF